MSYTIYRNLSVEQFEKLILVIRGIEPQIDTIIKKYNFIQTREYKSEFLGLDYTCNSNQFLGNICFFYEDKGGEPTFGMSIIKTYDLGIKRYYKSESIFQNESLESVINSIEMYFREAAARYMNLKREDLLEYRIIH